MPVKKTVKNSDQNDDALEGAPPRLDDGGADLPDQFERIFALNNYLASMGPERVTHLVYRHAGDNSSSPKEAVGKITDMASEVPTAFDIGERFKRAGTYSVLTEIIWNDAQGRPHRTVRALPVMRVGVEFEKPPAAAAGDAPATSLEGSPFGFSAMAKEFFGLFQQFTDAAVKLRGEAPQQKPVDVQAMEDLLERTRKDGDRRARQLQEELDAANARARRDNPPPKAESPLSGDNLTSLAEGAGTLLKVAKQGFDLLKGDASTAAADA